MLEGKILIVDDEQAIANLLVAGLNEEGYQVTAENSAEAALKRLEQEKFSLIITDLKMSGMTGMELIEQVRKLYPDTIVIIITGYATLETAQLAIKAGASDYITKPFNVGTVVMSVKNAFERYRLNRENVRLKEMVQLFKVSKAMGASVTIDNLLKFIVKSALAQTGSDRGSIMLIDVEKNELVIKASVGLDKEIVERTRIKVGEGISGTTAKECKPILVTDVQTHPLFKKMCRQHEDKSFISMPIITTDEEGLSLPVQSKNTILGVMNISKKKKGGSFTEADMEILSILASQAAISIENAKLFENLELTYVDTLRSLNLILEAKSPFTMGHSERVTAYAVEIGKKFNLPAEQLELLERAAKLHDIGKIGINDSILLKTGKLTADEYNIVKQHPVIGEEVLKPIKFLSNIRPIVRHHHERINGSGYPDGLNGNQISLLENIMAVADVYDAMSSNRPYRKAIKKKNVLEKLKTDAGVLYDREVINALCEVEK